VISSGDETLDFKDFRIIHQGTYGIFTKYGLVWQQTEGIFKEYYLSTLMIFNYQLGEVLEGQKTPYQYFEII
jgi:hypothetical protein